jgi:phosphatidylglycerol:prolipoprotein diacylglycerol transferase
MQQVLFWIPINPFGYFPDGIPVYAYGTMLFLTFVVCLIFASRRAARTGLNLPRERIQDLEILVFICGLAGARLTYMIQFEVPLTKFFRIWEGGIVLYGGIIGGTIAFILFHRYVLRRLNITLWQMGDLAAPSVCIGIAMGRVGCLMNGCCYGNVANSDCPSLEFPMLTAPAREILVDRHGLQTVTGFFFPRDPKNPDDVRTVIDGVEPNSPAAKAGLKVGDKIEKFKIGNDWKTNVEVIQMGVPENQVSKFETDLKQFGDVSASSSSETKEKIVKLYLADTAKRESAWGEVRQLLAPLQRRATSTDYFGEMLPDWPRGRNALQFVVERNGQELELPAFTPRSIGLHPTQVYEIISMLLLLVLCLSFYPFRQHDGQVWVLFMIGYAIHRFLNEILRIEPVEGMKMTLSQLISVGTLGGAIALEIYMRKVVPRRTPATTVPS